MLREAEREGRSTRGMKWRGREREIEREGMSGEILGWQVQGLQNVMAPIILSVKSRKQGTGGIDHSRSMLYLHLGQPA